MSSNLERAITFFVGGTLGGVAAVGGSAALDTGPGFDSLQFCKAANVVTAHADDHIGGNRYMLQSAKDGKIYQLDWADAPKGENLAAQLSGPDGVKTIGLTQEAAQCILERSP